MTVLEKNNLCTAELSLLIITSLSFFFFYYSFVSYWNTFAFLTCFPLTAIAFLYSGMCNHAAFIVKATSIQETEVVKLGQQICINLY